MRTEIISFRLTETEKEALDAYIATLPIRCTRAAVAYQVLCRHFGWEVKTGGNETLPKKPTKKATKKSE